MHLLLLARHSRAPQQRAEDGKPARLVVFVVAGGCQAPLAQPAATADVGLLLLHQDRQPLRRQLKLLPPALLRGRGGRRGQVGALLLLLLLAPPLLLLAMPWV